MPGIHHLDLVPDPDPDGIELEVVHARARR
jgi:hypothetical protein